MGREEDRQFDVAPTSITPREGLADPSVKLVARRLAKESTEDKIDIVWYKDKEVDCNNWIALWNHFLVGMHFQADDLFLVCKLPQSPLIFEIAAVMLAASCHDSIPTSPFHQKRVFGAIWQALTFTSASKILNTKSIPAWTALHALRADLADDPRLRLALPAL